MGCGGAGGVKMTISQSSKSQTQLSYQEPLGRVARFNGGGSASELELQSH